MSRKQFERFVLQKYLGGNTRKYKQSYNLIAYLVQRNLDSNNYVNRSYSFFNNCLHHTLHKNIGFIIKLDNIDDAFVILTIDRGESELVDELKICEVLYSKITDISSLNSKRISSIWGDGTVTL